MRAAHLVSRSSNKWKWNWHECDRSAICMPLEALAANARCSTNCENLFVRVTSRVVWVQIQFASLIEWSWGIFIFFSCVGGIAKSHSAEARNNEIKRSFRTPIKAPQHTNCWASLETHTAPTLLSANRKQKQLFKLKDFTFGADK